MEYFSELVPGTVLSLLGSRSTVAQTRPSIDAKKTYYKRKRDQLTWYMSSASWATRASRSSVASKAPPCRRAESPK